MKQSRARTIALSALVAFSYILAASLFGRPTAEAAHNWSRKLDAGIRFYQLAELGVLIVGTEKSLYAVESVTGEILWRRKNARLDETDVAPVPGTDLVLLGFDRDDKTRFEAVDVLSGDRVWLSDRVRGAPMQMAVDLDSDLLAVVVAKDARGSAKSGFKRRPVVHLLRLRDGEELWKHEIEREVEMMPARWEDDEVGYTLDNYHPPMFLDGRVYLFYEGLTSLDARTGKRRIREQFRINEEGLALTEADPVYDDRFIYISGRGRVRAVSRETSRVEWEARDLGLTPETLLANGVLYVRTGGRFTRLKDGETIERGPFGLTALDSRTGRTLWRYKGADNGISNLAMPDASTVVVVDKDDLIAVDAAGVVRTKIRHKIDGAAFVIINDRAQPVVGGKSEIGAFDLNAKRSLWVARHEPPSRGALRITLGIAFRAASLYFRYGGLVSTVSRGIWLARSASALRWSGVVRAAGPNLTSLAAGAARGYVTDRIALFGIAARAQQLARTRPPAIPRPSLDELEERLLDRIDPPTQAQRISELLLRRGRLASLRGEWMYFYTDLRGLGRGLAGVNVNTGRTGRAIEMNEQDDRFITDEITGLLYGAQENRLFGYGITQRN